jgi:putative transposase
VESWFRLKTLKAIRRGNFFSVEELISKIEQFISAYDKTKAPFKWIAKADSILEKLQRLYSQTP